MWPRKLAWSSKIEASRQLEERVREACETRSASWIRRSRSGATQVRHEDLEALIGTVPEELVRSLMEAILQQDVQSGVSIVNQAIDQGYDVRVYCREIVEQMRNLMVAAVVPSKKQLESLLELQQEEVESTMAQAQRVGEGRLQEWFEIFSRTENALRGSLHPRFVFEAAVIKATLILHHQPGTEGEN